MVGDENEEARVWIELCDWEGGVGPSIRTIARENLSHK